MNPPTNNWQQRRTEHISYAEIVTDITTRNSECRFELETWPYLHFSLGSDSGNTIHYWLFSPNMVQDSAMFYYNVMCAFPAMFYYNVMCPFPAMFYYNVMCPFHTIRHLLFISNFTCFVICSKHRCHGDLVIKVIDDDHKNLTDYVYAWDQNTTRLTLLVLTREHSYQVLTQGPGGSMSQVVGLPNNSYKPITNTA